MIISMRYYIIMSASIFLALGIGIFIGFTLDGQEIFVEQQQGLISELEQRFVEIKQENDRIESIVYQKEKELLVYREVTEQLLPQFAEDSLKGISVAIIQSSDELPYTGMINLLVRAGADTTSITRIKKDYVANSAENTVVLRESLDEPVESGDLCTYIAERLVNAVLTGGDEKFVRRMEDLGVIDVSGRYSGWVDFFILVGGGSVEELDMAERLDDALIDAIKKCNIPVVGVEKSGCDVSSIKRFVDAGISSVDNIDSIIGQYSLIGVLKGNVGHYGVKETAQAFIPDEYGGR